MFERDIYTIHSTYREDMHIKGFQFGSFANYLYSFTGGQAQLIGGEARTTSPLSDAIARDLKRRGMRYMGSVTVYSYLQAVGVVNDHEPGCFLHRARKGG